MHLLQITDNFTETVQMLSACIAIVLALYVRVAYKKYMAQIEHQKMLDQFLND